MKIIGFNQNIQWQNPKRNLELIESAFADQSADVFALPEMFTTGFCMEPEIMADASEKTLTWMKEFSKKKKSAVVGSVSVKEEKNYYNRMYFVKPDGNYTQYDKKHLFSYAKENEVYTEGKERIIVEYLGVKILLQICYDLRFPVFSRNRRDYDVILNIANWPETRIDAWNVLLKARAIENQAYVFGLNRVGTDGNNLLYPASSHCFFADGSEISTIQNDLVCANIDLEKLNNYRDRFPFLKDGDDFELKP